MTYSAISPLAVGTFHAAPRPKGGSAPAHRTARVGGGGATILSAAAARCDRLRALRQCLIALSLLQCYDTVDDRKDIRHAKTRVCYLQRFALGDMIQLGVTPPKKSA